MESASFWTPLGISVALRGGGGYEYFLELHYVSTLLKIKGYVMSAMYNINQMPTEFHVHQLNDFFFIIIITLEENSNIMYDKAVEQNFWLRLN